MRSTRSIRPLPPQDSHSLITPDLRLKWPLPLHAGQIENFFTGLGSDVSAGSTLSGSQPKKSAAVKRNRETSNTRFVFGKVMFTSFEKKIIPNNVNPIQRKFVKKTALFLMTNGYTSTSEHSALRKLNGLQTGFAFKS